MLDEGSEGLEMRMCTCYVPFPIGKTRAVSEMKALPSTTKQGSMFSPRDRELSAKRHAIKRLENSLMETRRELNELKKENRLLNRLQIRQEKEINRFQTQEGELPEILARHTEEVGNTFLVRPTTGQDTVQNVK